MEMEFISKRIAYIFLLITPAMLLQVAIISSQVFDEKVTSFTFFLKGLSPWFYVTYYLIVFFNAYLVFRKKAADHTFLKVYFLLILAFVTYSPLLLFKYPFQTELYKQAEVFYLLRRGWLSSSDSFGTTIFADIFVEATGMNSYTGILYFLPILTYVLTVLFMYISIKALYDEKIAFYTTLFFVSAFFEFFFTNRYSFVEPLYILLLFYMFKEIKNMRSWANSLIALILFSIVTITHIAFSTFAVIFLVCIALSKEPLKFLHFRSYEENQYTEVILWVVIFLAWNVFQWIDIVQDTYELVMRLVSSIFQGIFEVNVFGSLLRAPAKLEYEALVYGRSIFSSVSLLLPLLFLAPQLIKDRRKIVSFAPLLIFYTINLAFIVLGIGWITNSLRPYQLAITFAPFLLATAINDLKREDSNLNRIKSMLDKIMSLQVVVCLMLIIFLLWLPNLTYIGIPSKKIELINFATSHLPYHAQIYAVGWGEVDEGLFTSIVADRWDLFLSVHELDSIGTYLLRDVELGNISIPTNSYIYVDYSATRFELKYNIDISSRIDKIVSSFSSDCQLGLVYINSKYTMWVKY